MKQNNLKQYFPLIRERDDILNEIQQTPHLLKIFQSWRPEQQDEFLDSCSGVRGVKILYDSYFKEVMNPEYDSGRLESFLSCILERKVKIVQILPNDSTRLTDETTLLWTDIIVELEDGSLANIEVQKIGYSFPGERSACYSSDMLLRQYKRVRGKMGEAFSYKNIKNVYLVVIYEQSPKEFKQLPDIYYHHSRQVFDSGLNLNLLQEYIMIPLDIFHKKMHNKAIETPLEAWLTFLSTDEPNTIINLITQYPDFKAMYETLYQMCLNVEGVMHMFSEELRLLDQNTVKYMIEEQQKEIEEQQKEIDKYKKQLIQQNQQLAQKDEQMTQMTKQLTQQSEQITLLQKQMADLIKKHKA